jgi:hypothetical protein
MTGSEGGASQLVREWLGVGALLAGCDSPTAAGCPANATRPSAVAAVAARGIPGPADSATVRVGDAELLVVWKNLTSGRALTAACTWRTSRGGLRLVSEDLFDGTHILILRPDSVAGRLLYVGADGRVIRELPLTGN